MPYKISWEERGVVLEYSGHASDKDITAAVHAIEADERFDRLLYDVHDFRWCESVTFSQTTIEELAASDSIAARSLPRQQLAVAVVTDRQDVTAMVNAYLGSGFNLHEVRIFSKIEDARAWVSAFSKLQ